MFVLIPAYQPDLRLPHLIDELRQARPTLHCLVVDDGSGPQYRAIFEAAQASGATVISYPDNHGKGHALRQGFAYVLAHAPSQAVVTADADGQHLVPDILRVADEVAATNALVLGVRAFEADQPLRSKIGNRATTAFFALATGWYLRDTQTGLRAFPPEHLSWVAEVSGDRYEYELRVLLEASRRRVDRREVTVTAVYEPGNPTSHFNPIRDSLRIWAPLLGFAASSGLAAGVDYVLTLLLSALTGLVLGPMVVARVLSAAVNFAVNRRVFRAAPGTLVRTALRYALLAVAILAGSYAVVSVLMAVGVPLWLAKPVADVTMWGLSFRLQQQFVFFRTRTVMDEATPTCAPDLSLPPGNGGGTPLTSVSTSVLSVA